MTCKDDGADRGAGLRRARAELDVRVAERTEELRHANEELRAELAARKAAEAECVTSEQRRRLVFENMVEGFSLHEVITDDKGTVVDFRFLDTNKAHEQLTGLKHQDVVGKTMLEISPQADRRQIELYGAVALSGEPRSFEYYSKTFCKHLRVHAFSPQRGQFATVFDDMTERKRMDEALRESEERFRRLFERHSAVQLVLDSENGQILDANAAAVRFYGWPLEELRQMRIEQINTLPVEAVKAAMASAATSEHTRFEFRHRRADGSIRDVEVFCNRIEIAGKDLLHSIVHDITDRRQVEEELRRMALMVDTAPNSITVHDFEGRFFYANQKTLESHGYSRDEFLALNLRQLDVPASEKLISARMQELVERGEASFEAAHVRKDGTILPLEVSIKLTTWGGEKAILSVATDITERKRAEAEKAALEGQLQQAQKMESVGRLAGGVAHDFNNMLGVILGHTEMALDLVDPSQPIHAGLEEIRKAASRSVDLTRQLLAFARKQAIAPKVLDLNETVAGMLKMLQRLIGEDIRLDWQPAANLWPVRVDPSQIDQILANLCVNARDAIAEVGTVTIETGHAVIDEAACLNHPGFAPGEYVRIAVSDTGCGMDAATLAHIFEPFFTTKGVGKGTGLGLATVYGAVKQNNGFIHALSELGRGAIFTIYLPRHKGKAEQMAEECATGTAATGRETILLVEDEPAVLQLGNTMLERLGYTVLAAGTPGEAIRLAEEHPGRIHVLMTDVVMPDMNGRDLARHVLALYPDVKRVFMSGYTADIIAHQGVLDAGVHFIQKPFTRDSLTAKLREALDG